MGAGEGRSGDLKEVKDMEVRVKKEMGVEVKTSGANDVNGVSSQAVNEFFDNRIAYEWLSTKEAAHFLSLTENALRIMVHRGRVPVFRFGRRLRFRLKDCRALFVTKGA